MTPVFATGANGETLQINPNNRASIVIAPGPPEASQ